MKSIILSVQPKWCELIARGEKTIEVRKTAPKETPFKVYMYCTAIKDKKYYTDEFDIPLETGKWKGNSHIVGEFVCDRIDEYNTSCLDGEDRLKSLTCLDDVEIMDYMNNYINRKFYGLHITELKIYDEPKELSEFIKVCPMKSHYCLGCEFYSDFSGSCVNRLTRPPQSWQYVEAI